MQRIFVGDVQGCANELEALVARAEAAYFEDFALWVAGDLVNRGPDNRRSLERVRTLVEAGRAEYVLGNHEIHLLSIALGLRDLGERDSVGDLLGAPDAAEWIDWLRARPLVVPGRIGSKPFVMLHAATSPAWSLEELTAIGRRISKRLSGSLDSARDFLASECDEDPVRDALDLITRCRSMSRSGVWSSREPETPGRAWHRAWSVAGHSFGVVYGHWARQGLHVAPGLRGLDTGCVHHGRGRDGFLTAWLPDSRSLGRGRDPFGVPDDRFWQIPAERRYYYAEGEDR